MYANLTAPQFEELAIRIYHAGIKMFTQASVIHTEMASMATWTPEYAAKRTQASLLATAGREQNDLYAEIMNAYKAKYAPGPRSAAAYAAIIGTEMDAAGA